MKGPQLNKSEKVIFRLTPEQKRQLEKVAKKQKKLTSEFVRDLVFQEIGRLETAA